MGLKLKYIGGPHSKEKMFRGPQFMRKTAFAGRNSQEKLSKFDKFDQNSKF
jgi:hypothetical protein